MLQQYTDVAITNMQYSCNYYCENYRDHGLLYCFYTGFSTEPNGNVHNEGNCASMAAGRLEKDSTNPMLECMFNIGFRGAVILRALEGFSPSPEPNDHRALQHRRDSPIPAVIKSP